VAVLDILDGAQECGDQTVPDALLGCWRRNWIRFGPDGRLERQVKVIWLQTRSGMADMRVDPDRAPPEFDSSCGITVVDETTTPHVTADWFDGAFGFAQQPVPSFPEKGWLVWESPSIMRELAPSGAYVEEWERLPGSLGQIAHLTAPDAPMTTNLYLAGSHALLCQKSATAGGVHEFSWARAVPGSNELMIELSTNPNQLGQPLHVNQQWHIESYCET